MLVQGDEVTLTFLRVLHNMLNHNRTQLLKVLNMWTILKFMTTIIKMKTPLIIATAGHNQGLRTIPKMDMAIKISNMRGMEKTITLTGVRSLKITMMRMMICGDCSQHSCMQSPYLCIYDGVLGAFQYLAGSRFQRNGLRSVSGEWEDRLIIKA
jgi:hypothetical protein